jgi:membrane protein required for colicin V production
MAAQFTSVDVPSVRLMLGYGLCFVAVLVAGALVSFVLRKLIAGSGLSGTDRLFGMMFGLARGMLLVVLAVLMLGFTPFPRDPWWHESRLLPSFQNGAEWLSAKLPDSVTKHLDFKGLLERLPIQPPKPAEATQPAPAETKKTST